MAASEWHEEGRMSRWAGARAALYRVALVLFLLVAASLAWLRWDAGQSREDWFVERRGRLQSADAVPLDAGQGQRGESVRLKSDSELEVFLRVIRHDVGRERLPVLVVLGGHRTGSAAVELFGNVGERAIVAIDYPYDGPQSADGVAEIAKALPLVRRAFLDTPPALSLVVDWLYDRPWVDRSQIVMVGASLGVPFAATAAALDDRLTGLFLVHGAADNRLWLEKNLSRRMDLGLLQSTTATILHWFAYGPVFDTAERIAAVSPRPVLIVGAREDERTPEGQTAALFDAAREPKMLRWTEGRHVEPGRREIIDDLLQIADEEFSFFRLPQEHPQ
jgi:dienelactone hydrolase